MYTPKEKKKFMLILSEYFEEYANYFDGVPCIKAKFIFICDRPQAVPDYVPSALWKSLSVHIFKATRPDCDNYAKPTQDALSEHVIEKKKNKHGMVIAIRQGAKIFKDDSQIVDVRYIKRFRKPDEEAQIKIFLKEIQPYYYL